MDWFRLLSLVTIWISTCIGVDGKSCNIKIHIHSLKTIHSPGYPSSKVKHTCAEYKYTINAPSGTTIRATCPNFDVQCSKTKKMTNYLEIGSTKQCDKRFVPILTSSNKITMSYMSENFKAKKKNMKTFKFRCIFKVHFPPTLPPCSTPTPVPECHCGGTASSFGSRIVGGGNAVQGEFPYQVSIQYSSGNHYCGGSLISDEWVVTAAHCKVNTSHIVVLGTHEINSNSSFEQTFNIIQVINHPDYDWVYDRNDVAVVKLDREVELSSYVQPICLPDPFEDHSFINSTVEATGWGSLVEGGSSSNILQKVKLHVISNTECSSKGGSYSTNIFDENICTLTPGKDTCEGDSGGPIAYLSESKFFLVGITSWGYGCAKEEYPTVYTDVSNHYILKWIKENTGITCTASTEDNTDTNPEDTFPRCGGSFETEDGEIAFPDNGTYQHNADCVWTIRTTPGKALELKFTKFDLEASSECKYDYLQFQDGIHPTSPSLGKFCGDTKPDNNGVNGTNNYYIRLVFHSDSTRAGEGFALTWKTIENGCGGELPEEEQGHFWFPRNIGGTYNPNASCLWTMKTSAGKLFKLKFTEFNLEYNPTCEYDYLQFVNGLTEDSPSAGWFCGKTKPGYEGEYITNLNNFALIFRSDRSVQRAGFIFTWHIIDVDCSKVLDTENGAIHFPDKTGLCDDNNMIWDYSWVINTSPQKVLQLWFTKFDEEYITDCKHNYFQVEEGLYPETRTITRYCNVTAPWNGAHKTKDNYIRILFHSDVRKEGLEFKLSWETIDKGKHSALIPAPNLGLTAGTTSTPTPTKNTCVCGDRDSSFGSRIVGGVAATQGEFPYQVSIQGWLGEHFCGGSLISDQWIVTAAQCDVQIGHKIVLGENKLTTVSGFEQTFDILQVINHPQYSSSSHKFDVAVVKLNGQVTFSTYVQPICLPDPYEDHAFVGTHLEATGWGYLVEGGNVTDQLQKVELQVISDAECCTKGDLYSSYVFDESICALTAGNRTCKGNVGDPLAYYVGSTFYLAGIKSWGLGCATADQPGVYTDVPHHDILNWIKDNAGITCNAPTVA